MDRPNILLLTTDQQRYDTIRAMGYPFMVTPNLDRLVREGCAYPLAHSPNPACIPARHNIISGLPARYTKMDDNYFNGQHQMPQEIPTVAGLLQNAGYETIAVGKMHFVPARRANGFGKLELMEEIPRRVEDDEYAMFLRDQGYDHIQSLHGVRSALYMLPQNPLQPEAATGTVWVADRLIHHLKANGGQRPFFYWGSWILPHAPMSIPKRFADLYKDADLPTPIPPCDDPRPLTVENQWIGDLYDAAVARRAREYYYGAITWVDEQIGRVIETLEDLGQLDNTLILFTSDHGELLGDHGSYQKFQPYEASVRIPMVCRYPQVLKAGTVFDGFCDLNDILPTFLEAANVPYPGPYPLPGASLLQPVEGTGKDRRVQYVEHNHGARRWISLRTGHYKYVYYYSGGMEDLFDLEADPTEEHNLLEAPDQALLAVRDDLRTQLLGYEQRWGLENYADFDGFLKLEPITIKPRLPASFPMFGKHLADRDKLDSLAAEILKATADEPATDLRRLRWDDWLGQGLISQETYAQVMAGLCQSAPSE